MNESVLDASAVLALIQGEPGSDTIMEHLPGGAISTVNLSEIVAKLNDVGMPAEAIRAVLTPLGLEVHSFDEEAAYLSGQLRARTRAFGLSLGDRACLALGLTLSRPVVTTEQTWKSLRLGVTVILAR